MEMPERYTLDDFVRDREVSRAYALKLIKKGECPKAHWIGRKVYFLKEDYEKWIRSLYR